MTDELRRDVADDLMERASIAGDGRTVDLCLVRWDEVAQTPQGPETFARGAFAGTDPTTVLIESQQHGGAIVGAGQAIEERADGAYLVARMSDTTAARDLVVLMRDRVLRGASVVFAPITARRRSDGVTIRDRVELRRVAILQRGAYQSAGVLAIRHEVPNMTEPRDPDPTPDPPVPTPAPTPPDWSPILSRLTSQDDAIARLGASLAGRGAGGGTHELARFDTLGEAYMASTTDPEVRTLLSRALVDQITTDNPGLVQPGWLSDIKGIMPASRPGVAAFGGAAALPDSGMEIDWPTYTPGPEPIGLQVTEKSDVVSVKVSFGKASRAIATYAGASDVSYQLLRRSSPAYRDAYARIMLASYARVTDNAFVDQLAALSVATCAWDAAADTTGAAFVALLFEQSVAVQQATGTPADAVVAATDVFLAIASKERMVPPVPFPSMAIGSAQASTLRINASGMDIVHDPNLAAGKFLIGNSAAARWHESGPFPIEAEDVAKLGKNIAYWGLGAPAVYLPAGVVVGTATGTVGTQSRSRKPADG